MRCTLARAGYAERTLLVLVLALAVAITLSGPAPASTYACDGTQHSAQVYTGAVEPAPSLCAARSAQETVVAATGSLPVASWASVATNTAADSSRILLNTQKQLQQKSKHAADFGVAGNYNKANAAEFSRMINQHINAPGKQAIPGPYRGDTVWHYLDTQTGLNVIADEAGSFVSGWRLSPGQLENVLTRRSL